MMTRPQPLTPDELAHLAEIREVTNTVQTAGWQHILRQVERFSEEAHEDMLASVPSDTADTKANLLLRWQQREAILRGIRQYIAECESEKQQLLEQFKLQQEEKESVPLFSTEDRDY